MPAPLTGIKIVDFTRYQNGPHATLMLADLGAEIIKVEMPGNGDPGRALGRQPDGFCAYFEGLNRGKKSMTLNLLKPESREIVRKLVEGADVLTENFRPGFLDSIGLGYEVVRQWNPKIIFATNSGFGPRGEWRERGSFDVVAQGMSGAMVSNGGGPGNEPVSLPWGLADQVGSMFFAYGIVGAVLARERYGVGQKIDVSQLGAMLSLQSFSLVSFLHNKRQMTRTSNRPANPVFAPYKAADEVWLTIGVLDPKDWPKLCTALGRADLIDDERTKDAFARAINGDFLREELTNTIMTRPRRHWLDALIALEVPCGPVHDYEGVYNDPQIWENGYLVKAPHPQFPDYTAIGLPVVFGETPGEVTGGAPELGQHTEEVLLELGYTWEQMETLRTAGVI